MSQIRKLSIAAGTFGVALSIGFVMQNGDAMAARFGADVPEVEGDEAIRVQAPAELAEQAGAMQAGPSMGAAPLEGDSLTASLPEQIEGAPANGERRAPVQFVQIEADETEEEAPVVPVAVETEDETVVEDAAPEAPAAPILPIQRFVDEPASPVTDASLPQPNGADCDARLDAEVHQGALVQLELNAPCLPNAEAAIHHQGMIFTLITNGAGHAEVAVPALSERAVFIASFPEGTGDVAAVQVPAIVNYDRAVLQWQGESGLQIHAREFGADYGSSGHVWQAAARDAEAAIAGEGGFIMTLGDARANLPNFAQVYSFPSATAGSDGDVELTVEAEITAENCGREVSAQTIQIRPGSQAKALDLTMSMPDCDSVGDFLVLNNLLTDLTLAAR